MGRAIEGSAALRDFMATGKEKLKRREHPAGPAAYPPMRFYWTEERPHLSWAPITYLADRYHPRAP